jgi:primosomal protein N' (replication factor Y)
VIVQTFVPNHYAVRPVRDHDYESFYQEELAHRAETGFPPFMRLVHVVVSAPEEEPARDTARELAAAAIAASPGSICLGPAPAPLARLRGRYRYQLLVKGDAASARYAAHALVDATQALPEGVSASVDANPVHML